jgi:hypothetical protein
LSQPMPFREPGGVERPCSGFSQKLNTLNDAGSFRGPGGARRRAASWAVHSSMFHVRRRGE